MKKKSKMSEETRIILITSGVSATLIVLAMLSGIQGVIGNSVILAVFIMIVPFLLFRYGKFRTLKEYEERFPAFLRDVVEAIRSGMPLHQAIATTSRIDYGKFSDETKKMAMQISWGIPVDKVLNQFSERVKNSRKLFTTVKTIRESYLTGGDIISTLESVADNLITLEDSDKERKTLLSQYVVLMYAIAFIFVGIVIAINRLMVPIFEAANAPGGEEVFGLQNPCETNLDFPCSLFRAASQYVFNANPDLIAAHYLSVFFYMSMIVSITSGLVAGQISENSLTAGIKHSVVMSALVFGTMLILSQVHVIGV